MGKKTEKAAEKVSESALAVKQANGAAGLAMLLKVTDAVTQKQAADYLVTLKDVRVQAKEKLDFLVKPLKEHIKNITAEFQPGFDVLEQAESHLREQFTTYIRAEQDKANRVKAELMKKAEAAAKKGKNNEARDLAIAAVSNAGPSRVVMASESVATGSSLAHAQVSTRRPWVFKVVNESLVPDEFFSLDEAKLRAAVRSGARAIPGVEIFQDVALAVGGR